MRITEVGKGIFNTSSNKKEVNDKKVFSIGGENLSVSSLKRAPQSVFEMCKVFCL